MKGNRKLLFERRTPTGSRPFLVMFLWTLRCTTFNSIPIILILLTNKNVAFIHYVTICGLAPGFSNINCSTADVFFLTLAGFHNQSPLLTIGKLYTNVVASMHTTVEPPVSDNPECNGFLVAVTRVGPHGRNF